MIDLNKVLKNKIFNCIFICPLCSKGYDVKKEQPKVVMLLTQVPAPNGITVGTMPQPICDKCFKELDLMDEDIALATTMPSPGAEALLKATEGFRKK